MIDRYTKIVLTVIALALTGICIGQFTPKAHAQMGNGCGSMGNPCYVATLSAIAVRVQ